MVQKNSISSIDGSYSGAIKDYGMGETSCTKSLNYSGNFSGAVKKVSNKLWNHKGKIAVALSEIPIGKYIIDAGNVASNVFVEAGLKMGKVVTYPVRPEVLPWPHLVDTRGQIQIEPMYVDNPIVSGVLNASKNPLAVGIALATPLIIYGGYRLIEHYKKGRK